MTAQGVSTKQSDGSEIAWLSQGLQSLKLQVPFKPATPINPIQAIGINFLNLSFSSENPWSPLASSNEVQAQLSEFRRYLFSNLISHLCQSFHSASISILIKLRTVLLLCKTIRSFPTYPRLVFPPLVLLLFADVMFFFL